MSEPLLAAVDCGTNSVRLLVSRLVDGRLVEVDRRLHLTRLGQGVDATGRFHPEALARTLDAMADFGAELDELGVSHRRVVATSAARDAANSAEFFDGARARLGVEAEIIPGEEEARLSYAGAVGALPDVAQPVLVMDIGGGSTELVLGSDGQVRHAISLDIGSVRVRERFMHGDPPLPAEVAAATAHIDALLDASGIDFATVAHVGGCGWNGDQPLRARAGTGNLRSRAGARFGRHARRARGAGAAPSCHARCRGHTAADDGSRPGRRHLLRCADRTAGRVPPRSRAHRE